MHISSLHADPAQITNSSLNMTVNETAAVTLHCQAVGYPAPSITWSLTRNGLSSILTDVVSVVANSTGGSQLVKTHLTLSSAQPQDQGVYTCHASNSIPGSKNTIGSANTSFTLIVQSKGMCTVCSDNIYSFSTAYSCSQTHSSR